MTPAQKVSAVLAAAAVAIGGAGVGVGTGVLPKWEGFKTVGYADKVARGLPTTCYGNTSKAVVGKTYSNDDCAGLLAEDAITHGLEIARCLPDQLPTNTRAAFISIGYNIGSAGFCKSSMSRKALAGDLRGACASISLYTYSSGKFVQGLANRRRDERALCESGLAG